MSNRKINPMIYVTCGTVITVSMITIKFIAWVTYKAVAVLLLHE